LYLPSLPPSLPPLGGGRGRGVIFGSVILEEEDAGGQGVVLEEAREGGREGGREGRKEGREGG